MDKLEELCEGHCLQQIDDLLRIWKTKELLWHSLYRFHYMLRMLWIILSIVIVCSTKSSIDLFSVVIWSDVADHPPPLFHVYCLSTIWKFISQLIHTVLILSSTLPVSYTLHLYLLIQLCISNIHDHHHVIILMNCLLQGISSSVMHFLYKKMNYVILLFFDTNFR